MARRTAAPRPPLAAMLAVAVLATTAVIPTFTIVVQLAQERPWEAVATDPTTRFERRLAPLRAALAGTAEVGYLPPAARTDMASATVHLYTLTYALAPTVVRDGADGPLVVADEVKDPRALPPELEVVRDFGDGLFLLRRRPQ